MKGNYYMTPKRQNGRPVFSQEGMVFSIYYLYNEEDGTWVVNGNTSDSFPAIKSTTAASCPALCKNWLYTVNTKGEGGGPPWNNGDITFSCDNHKSLRMIPFTDPAKEIDLVESKIKESQLMEKLYNDWLTNRLGI